MAQRGGKLHTYAPSPGLASVGVHSASRHAQPPAHASTAEAFAAGAASEAAGSPATDSWQRRKAAQRAALEAQARHKEELARAATERARAADAAQREATFQALCGEVLGGLQDGCGILSEVQEVLDHAESAHQARRAALHRQWHSQVFDPLQSRLQSAVSQTSVRQLERALQNASQAYVTATNTKRLFRDVVIHDDYDPLAPLARSIRVPTGDLADPLLHDLLKTQAEQALLHTSATGSSSSRASSSRASGMGHGAAGTSCQHGLAKAVTRPVLQTTLWGAGQIHATPFGHCIDNVTAHYVVRPAAPGSLAQKASHVHFDDFGGRQHSAPPPAG